jgi:hypothetical protein
MGEHPNPDKTEERFTFSLDLYLNAGIRPGIEYFPPNAWGSEEKVHKHIREVSKQVYGKD